MQKMASEINIEQVVEEFKMFVPIKRRFKRFNTFYKKVLYDFMGALFFLLYNLRMEFAHLYGPTSTFDHTDLNYNSVAIFW